MMILEPGKNFQIQKFSIGSEGAPLIVIDNLVADPEQLVQLAGQMSFKDGGRFYPGIRAIAPVEYQRFLLRCLSQVFIKQLQLKASRLHLELCHYSVVTTRANELAPPQRIPHIDSIQNNGFAVVHYLFKGALGGTAFYRHRQTGFEYIDESRQQQYFQVIEEESRDSRFPAEGYINGDTCFFERIAAQEGVFNRMLIYRKNSLHSGSIEKTFIPDPNPLTGRLSINSFIEVR